MSLYSNSPSASARSSQPRPRTAVRGMLDRLSVADRDGGEQLTTIAIGRDGLGCNRTASQLRNTQHSLARAWYSSPRGAQSATAAHRGEGHARSTERC